MNSHWIEKKVEADLLNSLIDDYGLVTNPDRFSTGLSGAVNSTKDYKNDFTLIQRALRLSAHVLVQKPNQLPSRLVGRLIGLENPAVRNLVEQLNRFDRYPWFRPVTLSLATTRGVLNTNLLWPY